MIEKLNNNSRTTEVDGTTTQVIDGYNQSTLNTDGNMVKIFALLVAQAALLSAAIKRLKAKSEQQTNDEIRDEKITAFYYLLFSFIYHPVAEIKNAALSLFEIFEQYGLEMKSTSFTTESSLVNSMLAEYAKQNQQANIALVPQCAEYIAAIQEAQNNFETNRLSFEEAQGEEGTFENASKQKRVVTDTMNSLLVPYLNVMEQLEEPTYGAYARTVAGIIAANNEVVKKRSKKNTEPEKGED